MQRTKKEKTEINAERVTQLVRENPGINSSQIKRLLHLGQSEFWSASMLSPVNRSRQGQCIVYWEGKDSDKPTMPIGIANIPMSESTSRPAIAEALESLPKLTRWVAPHPYDRIIIPLRHMA